MGCIRFKAGKCKELLEQDSCLCYGASKQAAAMLQAPEALLPVHSC